MQDIETAAHSVQKNPMQEKLPPPKKNVYGNLCQISPHSVKFRL